MAAGEGGAEERRAQRERRDHDAEGGEDIEEADLIDLAHREVMLRLRLRAGLGGPVLGEVEEIAAFHPESIARVRR